MADAIIVAVVATLAILAIRHCRKHGAPCECGCNKHSCGGCKKAAAIAIGLACMCAATASYAEETEATDGKWNWAMGEGVTYAESPIVSTEVGMMFDSKYICYGLVINNEPILTPYAELTFFDWVKSGVKALFDTTHYGRHEQDEGYGSRKFRYQELDPYASIAHSFNSDDISWLPTTVDFGLEYMYEQHPKRVDRDTQFITLTMGLPDLWIEPFFLAEFDIERDHGTYLNFGIGHTFALIDGEEGEDPLLDFRLSLAQGWGDKQRIAAYLPDVNLVNRDGEHEKLSHAGLMDTCVKGELGWNICRGVRISTYLAYYDFLFDKPNRTGNAAFEMWGDWDVSWNIIAGAALSFSF